MIPTTRRLPHVPFRLASIFTRAELARAFRDHRLLLAIILLHAAAAIALALRYPALADTSGLTSAIGTSLLLGPLYILCGYALYVMVWLRPRHLVAHLAAFMFSRPTLRRTGQALPVLLSIPVFTYSFATFKAAVPVLHPYALDAQWHALDLTLHGGIAPWAWLQQLIAYPLLTSALNVTYHLWYFIVLSALYLMAFASGKPQLRMQFLLSFVLSWIVLGNVLAIIASSAGPCYYGQIVPGADPYAPLMAYLQEANRHYPVWALNVQQILWTNYHDSFGSSALGIAAMPSMHVASSVLVALLGWRLHRAAGIAGSLFALLIMIGSVHLGWHYAVDGYVGAAGAALIWYVAGRLTAPLAAWPAAPSRLLPRGIA
jgi:hypothetical protein